MIRLRMLKDMFNATKQMHNHGDTKQKKRIHLCVMYPLHYILVQFYYLKILTNNDATEVTIPMNENHIVVDEPIAEFFALTLLGST